MESLSSDIQVVSYITAGFLTLSIYDTLLQINDEYRLVWKSRWTLIKCLYMWTRYSTFVSIVISFVNLSECNKIATFTTAFSGSIIGVTELILMVRTYTLYERSKKLLAFFFVLWFSIAGVAIWAVTKWISAPTFASLDAGTASCWLSNSSGVGIGLVCYACLLVGETAIVFLTLLKVVRKFHNDKTALLNSLYSDGVLFYLAIWPVTIATVALLFWAPPGLNHLPDAPVLVMHSVLSCRLITHARAIAEEEDRRAYAVNKPFRNTGLLSDAVVDISPENKV